MQSECTGSTGSMHRGTHDEMQEEIHSKSKNPENMTVVFKNAYFGEYKPK